MIRRSTLAAFGIVAICYAVVRHGQRAYFNGWLSDRPWVALAILGIPTAVALYACSHIAVVPWRASGE